MTKSQIIAELRRSAAEDARPCCGVDHPGWLEARLWSSPLWSSPFPLVWLHDDDCRTFFLLVACALEDGDA